jgi:hypothetical protein
MGDMRRDMIEYLTNSHKADLAVGRTTFARIELRPCDWDVLRSGAASATMLLPILKQEEVVRDMDVAIPHCSGVLSVRAEWRPTSNMMKMKPPAMPEGLLRICVVGAAGFPAHFRQRWRCIFQVPEEMFTTITQEMTLSLCEPVTFDTPRDFNIRWLPEGVKVSDDSPPKYDEPHSHDPVDEATFRRRTLSLLQEQHTLILEQSQKMDAQSRQIEEYTRRLERLEGRLQDRLAS